LEELIWVDWAWFATMVILGMRGMRWVRCLEGESSDWKSEEVAEEKLMVAMFVD